MKRYDAGKSDRGVRGCGAEEAVGSKVLNGNGGVEDTAAGKAGGGDAGRGLHNIVYNILGIAAWLVIVFLIVAFLRKLLMDDVDSQSRVMFHEFYGQEQIDVLFTGSSHSYRSLDPAITDGIFGCSTFNVGTSLQQLDGTYAILRDAAKRYDIKEVYLDLYFENMASSPKADRMDLTSTYIVSDYMKPSLNRTRYLLQASDGEHWINSFILPRRNWRKLMDPGYISDLWERKSADSYKDFAYVGVENEYYCGRGYVASTDVLDEGTIRSTPPCAPITADYITPDNEKDLRRIIDFCQKRGIKITLYSAPMPDPYISGAGNYDDYIAQMSAIAAEYGLRYYDFNLLRPEYFSSDITLFADMNHLNRDGSVVFSNVFSKFFTGQIDEADLFYGSYEEKLRDMYGGEVMYP